MQCLLAALAPTLTPRNLAVVCAPPPELGQRPEHLCLTLL